MTLAPVESNKSPTKVTLGPLQSREVSARFVAKIRVNELTGCWIWRAHVTKFGYGQFSALDVETGEVRTQYAHRVAYEAIHGPVREGLDLDHLCCRRNCANPDHVEPVTRRVNLLRGDTISASRAAQTHCENGHPLAGENLYVNPGSRSRTCRICRAALYRSWVAKNRERRREIDRAFGRARTKRKQNRVEIPV